MHELVQALVDEADLDLSVAHLLERIVQLVRQLAAIWARLRASRVARGEAGRREAADIRLRAYGLATSKTLKSG